MATFFWLLVAFVAYVYIGYPLGLHVWRRLWPRPLAVNGVADRTPGVSIVIAARNEGRRLAGRINNLLNVDYPEARRQIIIVSDGSTDDSLEVLARYEPMVESVALSAGGKARALNAGVERARFELLVFADARQAFAPEALRALVAPFSDPQVGAVSGELVLEGEARDRRTLMTDRRGRTVRPIAADADRRAPANRRHSMPSTIAEGVGLYWRYEKQIRRDESAIASTMGATGAMYAMRLSLWRPLPEDTILDDVLAPMRCVLAGSRVVFDDRARAYDRAARNATDEIRRKRRTLAGNYQLFWLEPALLLPWRNPAWIQFVSHKVARLAVPYALPPLWLLSLLLSRRSVVYAAAFAAQCLFYLFATYGAWLEKHEAGTTRDPWAKPPVAVPERLARVALMVLVMNASAVAGLAALLTRQKVWR
jgi:cellulose synthase/poly-beta-1,6-N-acetylglucosamine synthase-like glycosyltransferase